MIAAIDCLVVVSVLIQELRYRETFTQLTKYETARYPVWYAIVELLQSVKSSKGRC
jgi:hypothetical protein